MDTKTFQTKIDNLVLIINESLEKYYKKSNNRKLYSAFEYTMKGGGKRVRPILCMLCARAASGSLTAALGPALAAEILHNFTLVHDDIMDDSPVRHNQPTVYKK
jgi:geranylgeranyl diphosphate synthase type II